MMNYWKLARRTIYAGTVLILSVGASYALLQYFQFNRSWESVIHYFNEYTRLSLLACFLLFVCILLLLLILNDVWLTAALFTVSSLILGIANSYKIQYRSEPIFPRDFSFINSLGELLSMVNLDQVKRFVPLLVLAVVVLFVFRYIEKRIMHENALFPKIQTVYLVRIGGIICCFIMLWYAGNFNNPNNKVKELAVEYGFESIIWDQSLNYERNTFIMGFLENIPGIAMLEPDNYNLEYVEERMAYYQTLANATNEQRLYDDFSDVNVIYILSESLADPSRFTGTNLETSPISYIQSAADKAVVGTMISSTFGGGTSDVEYEVLTGFSVGLNERSAYIAYQSIVPKFSFFPSIVDFYKVTEDQTAAAIHPYNSKMFKRRDVFDIFGFDTMKFEDDLTYTDTVDNSPYISDASAFSEIYDMLVEGTNPQFMHLITMQNHSTYSDVYNQYDFDPKTDDPSLDDTLKYYIQGIHLTDQATQDFIAKLEDLDEKVMVVFYGDHSPGIYSNLFDANDYMVRFQTDFFIYSNYTNRQKTLDSPISATALTPLMLEIASVKTNAFYTLLESLREEFPYNSGRNFFNKEGEIVDYESMTAEQQQLVDDYILFQYDIVEGNQYTLDAFKSISSES